MVISEKQTIAPFSLLQSPSYIRKTSKTQLQNSSIAKNYYKFTVSIPQPIIITPTLQKSFFQNQDDYYFILKKKGKNFLNQNSDNGLVQNSLNAVNDMSQFFNETDELMKNLTQNMLYSLELELDQYLQQQTNDPESFPVSYHAKSSVKHKKPSTIQKNQITTKISYYEDSNENWLIDIKKIFNLTNLVYLISLLIFFSILTRLMKFILFRKFSKYKSK